MRAKVTLVGAGGVGGIVAASLALGRRCDLSVVARGNALTSMQTHGIIVNTAEGSTVVAPPDSYISVGPDQTEKLPPQDYVLVSTKAHQVGVALSAIKPILGPSTQLVTVMNGLPYWWRSGNEYVEAADPGGRISAILPPPERVIGSVGFVAGNRQVDAKNRYVWNSTWPMDKSTITFGPAVRSSVAGPAVEGLCKLFDSNCDIPIPVLSTCDVHTGTWNKLMINSTINTLATVCGLDCGELVDDPNLEKILRDICAEVTQVAAAEGVTLTKTADDVLDFYRGRFGTRPSMLQDYENGRELEKRPIVDAVLELGIKAGIGTQSLLTVARIIESLESRQLKLREQ